MINEKLSILGYPQMWSMSPSTSLMFLMSSSISVMLSQVSIILPKMSTSSISWVWTQVCFFLLQTIFTPACLQPQKKVMQAGRIVMGSPLIKYLLDSPLVRESKCLAHLLFPTLGDPKVITLMSSKTLLCSRSMKARPAKAPPSEIPEMYNLLRPVCALISRRSRVTLAWILFHILLQVPWTLHFLHVFSSTLWKGQRRSCQRLRALAVYLKARTTNSGQTLKTLLISDLVWQML